LQDGSDLSSLKNWIPLTINIAASASTQASEENVIDIEECVNDVMHIVQCLYEFSVTVRYPAPRDRLEMCSNVEVSHFEIFDIGHISNKFPQASDFLQERCGKANTRRRQLIEYHRLHNDIIRGGNTKEFIPDFDGGSDTSRARTVFSEASLGQLEIPPLPNTAQDHIAPGMGATSTNIRIVY
jgi:hypothetical protein